MGGCDQRRAKAQAGLEQVLANPEPIRTGFGQIEAVTRVAFGGLQSHRFEHLRHGFGLVWPNLGPPRPNPRRIWRTRSFLLGVRPRVWVGSGDVVAGIWISFRDGRSALGFVQNLAYRRATQPPIPLTPKCAAKRARLDQWGGRVLARHHRNNPRLFKPKTHAHDARIDWPSGCPRGHAEPAARPPATLEQYQRSGWAQAARIRLRHDGGTRIPAHTNGLSQNG